MCLSEVILITSPAHTAGCPTLFRVLFAKRVGFHNSEPLEISLAMA